MLEENLTLISEDFWMVSFHLFQSRSESHLVDFQDFGGYPDLDNLAEMNENNHLLFINPESKTFH